jgi:magnesium chelatase subunit I
MTEQNSKNWGVPIFPFTAIVGQDEMKLALILNVIDPKIGGILIMGDRGTGKSTTIRAIADLLPNIEAVADDSFNSHPTDRELMSNEVLSKIEDDSTLKTELIKVPMIELPLGATEDRVCGTIDIEKALTAGVKSFEPGLLAKSNRGILYVDEINLLDDHLVDVLLDSAASGRNTVEREGISIRHPARFVLVGSGNPEEGELRPQLLDRFGMQAEVVTERDATLRVKIVQERLAFDESPQLFIEKYAKPQQDLRDRIVNARALLADVEITEELRTKISEICGSLYIDGLRGDLVATRAAQAHAAYDNRKEVTNEDVRKIIVLCLRHRLRKDPMDIDYYDNAQRIVMKQYLRVFGLPYDDESITKLYQKWNSDNAISDL